MPKLWGSIVPWLPYRAPHVPYIWNARTNKVNPFADGEVLPTVGAECVERLVDGEVISVPLEQRRLLLTSRLVTVQRRGRQEQSFIRDSKYLEIRHRS